VFLKPKAILPYSLTSKQEKPTDNFDSSTTDKFKLETISEIFSSEISSREYPAFAAKQGIASKIRK
jgi:hypothetical protein